MSKTAAREQAEKTLAKGNPVLVKGKLVQSAADLPENVNEVQQMRDDNNRLTYEAMEALLDSGQSVMMNDGTVITNKDDLPTREEYAKQITDANQRTVDALDNQIAGLSAQRQALANRAKEPDKKK